MNAISGAAAGTRPGIFAIARRGLHPGTFLSIGAPIGVYQVLTGRGVSEMDALLVAAVFPLIAILGGAIKNRRLDLIGALSLGGIALGIVGGLILHDPRILLVKESIVTGLIGIAFLGSLLGPRPLMFVIGRKFATGGDRDKLNRFDALWETPSFRANSRRLTLIWGAALVTEAVVRLALSFVLAPAVLMAISPVLAIGTFGSLALWTLRHRFTSGQQPSARATA